MTRISLPSPSALRTLLTGYPDGAAPWVRDLADSGDDGWFGPGSTVWAVHVDAATLVPRPETETVNELSPGWCASKFPPWHLPRG